MPSSFELDAKDVRSIVSSVHPEARETATHGASVISFLIGIHSKETLCRINVYLESGTVGCIQLLNDEVRECFKRSIATREALVKALRDPPRFSMLDDEALTGGDADARDVTAKIELAEVGVCILMGEREKLQSHLKAIQEEDDDDDDDTASVKSDDNDTEQSEDETDKDPSAGLEFDYSLSEDVLLQTDQCLEDIGAMDKHVSCVSTNGKGCVFLYGNGGVAYTPNIPKQLYQKLKALKTNPKATRPVDVTIGTRERYYVSFHDETFDWKGPKSLGTTLKKVSKPPRCIAFGPAQDAYFIVYHDGSWEYNGRSIPQELINKLIERKERPDLVCVTLGPKGEWFLRTENGRLWWGGIGDELDVLIQSLLETDRFLNFLDFGEDHSYFVSYD